MKLHKLLASLFLTSVLPLSVANANQCVEQRFQINASTLTPGDVVELGLGGQSVSLTLDNTNFQADLWPQHLGWKVRNNVSADVASIGDLGELNNLDRYIPKSGSSDNYLDVFSEESVTLTVNGIDQSSMLVTQQLASVEEKSFDLPLWVTGSGNNAFLFLTNLSDQPMPVKVELFNENGGTFTTSGSYTSGFAGNPTQASGTTLAAKSSAYLHISNSAFVFGTGKVTWTPNSCNPELMVSINQTLSHQTDVFRLNGGAPL